MIVSHAGMASTNGQFHDKLVRIAPRLIKQSPNHQQLYGNKNLVLSKRRSFMKQAVTNEYITAVRKFGILLANIQNKTLPTDSNGDTATTFIPFHDSKGRKFDRLYLAELDPNSGHDPRLQFFIDRTDGSIYGIKSDVCPNLKRYYGTIYNCSKWNWECDPPAPVNDDTVQENDAIRRYGRHNVHWTKVKQS